MLHLYCAYTVFLQADRGELLFGEGRRGLDLYVRVGQTYSVVVLSYFFFLLFSLLSFVDG